MRSGLTLLMTVLVATSAFLMAIGLGQILTLDAGEFVKQETLQLQADRINSSIVLLDSMPRGSVEIDISGYGFNYSSGEAGLNYSGKLHQTSIRSHRLGFDRVESEVEFAEIDGHLCIRKKIIGDDEVLSFSEGGC